jgi:hypothetical protein
MVIGRRIHRYAVGGQWNRRWYVHARIVVARLATMTGQTVGRCADVLAILSPRIAVQRNLVLAYRYLRDQTLGVDVPRSTRAAMGYYERTGRIRGPKTGAFARALRGADDVVVVDTHLAKAFGYEAKVARSLYVRKHVARVLGRIARGHNWTMVECQACVWAGYYRATYPSGRVPKYRVKELGNAGVPF